MMEFHGMACSSATPPSEEDDLRRGPWTVEEDLVLMNYIAAHGEGRWNSLARSAGLKRTGKSCRLRWLNYLRPDVRRGNITPEEQLLILELHSRWGNRWSKIAQHLPGRTDNEIKNYWRTRVQKHAKQLQCDVNSKQFKDVMRYIWMPRLVERIRAASARSPEVYPDVAAAPETSMHAAAGQNAAQRPLVSPENSSSTAGATSSSAEFWSPPVFESFAGSCGVKGSGVEVGSCRDWLQEAEFSGCWPETSLPSSGVCGTAAAGWPEFDLSGWNDSLWSMEDIWLHQQLWSD